MSARTRVLGRDTVAVLDRVVNHVREIECQSVTYASADDPLAGVLGLNHSRAAVHRAWGNVLASVRNKHSDLITVGEMSIRACAWSVKVGSDIVAIERGSAGAAYRVSERVLVEAGNPTPIDGRDEEPFEPSHPREVFVRLHHVWQNFVFTYRKYCDRRANPSSLVEAAVRLGGRLAWAADEFHALAKAKSEMEPDDGAET